MATDEEKCLAKVDIRFKLHEAFWKQMVSRTHSLFCNCGQFLKHFKWQDFTDEDGSQGADAGDGDVKVNFDLGFQDVDGSGDGDIRYECDKNVELSKM